MGDEKQGRRGAMAIDTALVRELAELLDETGLSEIEVEDSDRKIRVARSAFPDFSQFQAPAAAPAAAPVDPVDDAGELTESPR